MSERASEREEGREYTSIVLPGGQHERHVLRRKEISPSFDGRSRLAQKPYIAGGLPRFEPLAVNNVREPTRPRSTVCTRSVLYGA